MPDNQIDAFTLNTWEERGGEYVRRLARDFSLTPEQAAGLVGNLGFESAGFKTLQEIAPVAGGRGGWGIAQWTGPRRRAFEAWCVENNLKPSSDEANYGFLLVELRGSHKSTIAALKKASSLDDAVFSVGLTYERPGGTTETHLPGFSGRLRYAERALAGAASGDQPAPAPAPVEPSPKVPEAEDYGVEIITAVVRVLQLELRAYDYYQGKIDGIWGAQSEAAMQEFRDYVKEQQ